MSLYEEIIQALFKEQAQLLLHAPQVERIVGNKAIQALEKIKDILSNDEMDDKECFWRIEEIVRVFEELGSDAGNRHDFS